MSSIRTLSALLSRQQRRPPSLDNSPLALLHPEIVQHIASFLPPSAAASVASTCLAIRLTTGTQYLTSLKSSRNETLVLLGFLLYDLPIDRITGLPSRIICAHCVRLIPIDVRCGSGPAAQACAQACALSREHIYKSFWPPLFHTALVMDRYHLFTNRLLSRLTPRTTTTHDGRNGITTQCDWKCRIWRGTFYLRGRETHILPRSYLETYIIRTKPCSHSDYYQRLMDDEVAFVQGEVRKGSSRSRSRRFRCLYCRTGFSFGARRFRARGIGLFMSWWRDLGDGRSGPEEWSELLRPTAPRSEWEEVSYDANKIIDVFKETMLHDYEFDFDGVDRADRKELFRLSPYLVKSRK